VDAGGGSPLGENLGIATEAVFHGAAEAFDKIAGFLDEGAVVGGVADVFDAVVDLLGFLAIDGGEVGLEIGDEIGGHGVGDVEVIGHRTRQGRGRCSSGGDRCAK
jgi:hypothetical protein